MKLLTLLFFLIIRFGTCQSQLLKILKGSENISSELIYYDKYGYSYEIGPIRGGHTIDILFDRVEFKKKRNTFIIEGRTITPAVKDSAFGFCCIDMYLATTRGDSIYNIRGLGESNSIDINPNHPDGYFIFEVKINPNDKLFFSGSRRGLKEYFIDRLIKTVKD